MSKKATLGDVLKEARLLKDVTLREVEQKTKISNAYISQLESGIATEPSPHKLHSLAKFYGVEYMLLMELAGYYVPSEKKSNLSTSDIQALLLTQQPLTEDESHAVAAYLMHYRQMKENRPDGKAKKDHKQ